MGGVVEFAGLAISNNAAGVLVSSKHGTGDLGGDAGVGGQICKGGEGEVVVAFAPIDGNAVNLLGKGSGVSQGKGEVGSEGDSGRSRAPTEDPSTD